MTEPGRQRRGAAEERPREEAGKRPYRPPRLEVYGDVAELTRAAGDKGMDGIVGSNDGT